MPSLRVAACLALAAGLSAAVPVAVPWAQLERQSPPRELQPQDFDPKVIGNLAHKDLVDELTLPRSHAFIASIMVGTPPQKIRCLLDSGSADLWIPSKKCSSCQGERYFRADESDTFKPMLQSDSHFPGALAPVAISVPYGDNAGHVGGFLVQDTVRLGPVALANQTFIIVEQESLPDTHRSWDGVCGLGWQKLAVGPSRDTLYEHFSQVDGRALITLAPGSNGQVELTLGSIPSDVSIAWTNIEDFGPGAERTFWISSGAVALYRKDGPMIFEKSRLLLDTGSEFILAPRHQYLKFVRAFLPEGVFDKLCGADSSQHIVVCDCAVMEQADPSLTVILHLGETVAFELTLRELIKRVPLNDDDDDKPSAHVCLPQIQQKPPKPVDPVELLGKLMGRKKPAEAISHAERSSPALKDFPFPLKHTPRTATGDETEEVVRTLPNGTVCTTYLHWVHKGKELRNNFTKCEAPPPESVIAVRKLQASRYVTDMTQMVATDRKVNEDSEEDVWILGAAFMEHAVIVLDFDQARMGLGRPAGDPHAVRIGDSSKPLGTVVSDQEVPAVVPQQAPIRGMSRMGMRGEIEMIDPKDVDSGSARHQGPEVSYTVSHSSSSDSDATTGSPPVPASAGLLLMATVACGAVVSARVAIKSRQKKIDLTTGMRHEDNFDMESVRTEDTAAE